MKVQRRNLVLFVAKPSVPISIVEDKNFRNFLQNYNPHFDVSNYFKSIFKI